MPAEPAGKHADVVCVFGRRGSGKSTFVKSRIKAVPRVVVFDPMGEYPGRACNTLADVAAGLNAARGKPKLALAYRPPVNREAEALHHLCEMLIRHQAGYQNGRHRDGVLLVVEEADQGFPSAALPSHLTGMKAAILRGRHAGISILAVSQRPALVSATLRSNAAAWIVFALADHVDYQVVRQKGGPAALAAVQTLPSFSYVRLADGTVTAGTVGGKRAKSF